MGGVGVRNPPRHENSGFSQQNRYFEVSLGKVVLTLIHGNPWDGNTEGAGDDDEGTEGRGTG